MNHETINHSARNGLLWKIGRFLWLFFWEYPARREENQLSKIANQMYLMWVIVFGCMGFLLAPPHIHADKFPLRVQTTMVEGRMIRHPTLRGGSKYVSEPVLEYRHSSWSSYKC